MLLVYLPLLEEVRPARVFLLVLWPSRATCACARWMARHHRNQVPATPDRTLKSLKAHLWLTKATRGYTHNCLGIAFGFVDRKVKINMVECILNVSKEFPVKFKEMNGNIASAGVDLFSEDLSKKLSEEMKTTFHQTVAQDLFSCKRAKPDTQPMMLVL